MFGFGKAKAIVGLDIGSSAVKAVELKPVGKGFKVSAFAIEPIPPDSIVDGAIIDGTAVADAIRRLFENKAFKSKDVAASLSGNAVIVKKINLPVMTEAELAESIYWEAEQYIPFDIQDVNLDYQILDAGTGEEAKGTMEVLLVAAKKEKIADYTGVISQAGRVPVVVDVDAFALQNAYEVNYGLEADHVVVLVNAGASAININIVTGDQSVFTRDISIGGNSYTEAVQKELNLPFDAAEQLKKGLPVEGASLEEVKPILQAMTENVLLEIQKTFDFFKATASSDRIDRIVLSGGASRVDGFAQALQERFGTTVESFDPFRKIAFNLLAADHDRSKKKAAAILGTAGQKMTIGCTVILLVAALFVGWRYWTLTRQSSDLDRQISAAQQETTRLRSVIQQVQQFEQRKAQLQQRVVLIEQLRKGQTGPVHMLDQISRALPPMLWLTELKQIGGDVVIDGRATSPIGVSDFVANLEATGYFKRSIEIVSTTTEPLAQPPGELIRFSLRAIFQQPGETKAPGAAQAPGGDD